MHFSNRFPARRKKRDASGAEVTDEDAPLSRRVDPRLRKPKEGSLGQLLASKSKQDGTRSTRFSGSYYPPSPPRRHNSPPASPDQESSPVQESSRPKISFEINKHKKSHHQSDHFKDGKRFTIKRNNEETNPGNEDSPEVDAKAASNTRVANEVKIFIHRTNKFNDQ